MERCDESIDVGAVTQRQPGEHEPRSPSLGALVEQADRVWPQAGRACIEEPRRLLVVEAEVIGSDLGELVAYTQSAESERGIDSCRHDDCEICGPERDELLDAAVHVVVRDEVVVVDHEHDVIAAFGDLVHDATDRRIETVADG